MEKKITYLYCGKELRLTNTFTYCNLKGAQKNLERIAGIKLTYLPTRFKNMEIKKKKTYNFLPKNTVAFVTS